MIRISVPQHCSTTADLFKRDAKTSDKTLLCHRLVTVVNLISLAWNKILISYNDSPRAPLYPDRLRFFVVVFFFVCVCVFLFLILLHHQSQFTQILEPIINVQVSLQIPH